MKYRDIIFEKEDGIAIITLNRPERLNAISTRMMQELLEAVEDVSRDVGIKVLIVTGAGERGFCSGADLAATKGGGPAPSLIQAAKGSVLDPVGTYTLRIRELDKPTIAAVNGVAAGAGFSIATVCDIRIASEKARFGAFFIRRAMICNEGSTLFLPSLVGPAKALELMFTGDLIDAREAERIGLVNRVVPHEALLREAKELASRIATAPFSTLAFTKRAVYRALGGDLMSQLIYEAFTVNATMETEDFKEGIRSFLEKREAVYKER